MGEKTMTYSVGIDLGGTNIAVGIVDKNGRILQKHNAKTNANQPFEALVADIAAAAREAVALAGLSMADIASVGMGVPSAINPKTGLVVNANNLNWFNVPLHKELSPYFPCPLFLGNDADCAALGEVMAGAARDYEDALMITLGTGVGSGIIINRRIFNGYDQMGGEVGHMKLIYGGVRCSCGQLGCFEAYASATALIQQARDAIQQNPDSLMAKTPPDQLEGRTVFDAAHAGDETALRVVDQYISYLAAGIGSVVAVLRPQVVIIGGGISHQGDFLLKPLNRRLFELTYSAGEAGVPPVIAAALGNDAGIIGAAFLGQKRE